MDKIALEEKINDLETAIAHQDVYIKELNEVVISQGKLLSSLSRELEDLKKNINQKESGEIHNEKPPHY